MRIVWMPFIYAMNAWLGLRFRETTVFWNSIRDLYEARRPTARSHSAACARLAVTLQRGRLGFAVRLT